MDFIYYLIKKQFRKQWCAIYILNGPTEHLSSIQDVSQHVLSSAILRM